MQINKLLFPCKFLICLFLCCAGIQYCAAAADIAVFRQSLAKETPGSDQWKKLHQKYCNEAGKSPEQLEQAIAFYKKELEKENAPELKKYLATRYIAMLEAKADQLSSQSKVKEADRVYREAVAFSEKELGMEHKTTAAIYHRYAYFCRISGNNKEAEKLYLESTEKYKKIYGAKHHITAAMYGNLGILYRSIGKYEQSEKYFKLCLSIEENSPDLPPRRLLHIYNQFGTLYYMKADYTRAKQYFLKALDISEKKLGMNTASAAESLSVLGSLYKFGGDNDKALACYDRALKIQKHILATKSGDKEKTKITNQIIVLLKKRSELLFSQSKVKEADRVYREALMFFEKELGMEHRSSASLYEQYAGFCHRSGNYKEAEKFYLDSIEKCKKIYGERHHITAQKYGNLANLYESIEKYEQAEKYYKIQLDIYKNTPDLPPSRLAFVYNNFGIFYRIKGDHVLAEQYLLKALDLKERKLGPDHSSTALTLEALGDLYKFGGDNGKALACYDRALKIQKHVLAAKSGDKEKATIRIIALWHEKAALLSSQSKIKEADQVYREAVAFSEKELGMEHRVTVNIYNSYAIFCRNSGNYQEAEKLYLGSIEKCKKIFGEGHHRTAQKYGNLANLYTQLGKYEQAEKYYKLYQDIYENTPNLPPSRLAFVYNNYGDLCRLKGDYVRAEQFLLKALEIRKKVLGFNHSYTAYTLDSLGKLYSMKADYRKAISFYTRALEIREHVFESDPGQKAETQKNLANVYYIIGQYRQAEKLDLAALDTAREAYGEFHVTVGGIYMSLGKLRRIQGKYDDALSYYRKSLKVFENKYGKDHIDVAKVLNNIGNIYNGLADYSEAEKYYLRSMEIKEIKLGRLHPLTGSTYGNFASLCISRGQYEKAEEFVQKALDIFQKHYGERHDRVALAYALKAKLAKEQKDYQKALEYYEKAYQIYLDLFGEGHVKTAGALRQIGAVHAAMNNFSPAEMKITQALKIYRKLFPDGHIGTAGTLLELGKLYRSSGRKEPAVSTLRDALNMYEKFYKPSHPDVEETCRLLGELYTEMNDPVSARKYFQKSKAETVTQKDIYADLSGQQSKDAAQKVPEYAELLKNKLSSSAEPEVKKLMTDFYQKSVNLPDFSEKLIEKFDALEKELRQKKQFQEQILFLKGFSETGFSDLFPEARKNYFGNLEDTIDEAKLSVEKQLMALTVLASDYLRNETFFADGKERSAEAIEKAKESKHFSTALKLYRITLRRLLQFDDKKFGSIRQDAEKTAQSCSDAEYQTMFKALDQLHRLKAGNGKTAIDELQKLAVSHSGAVSAEVISFIEYNTAVLSREDIDIVRLLSSVSADAIASAPPMLRRRIASALLNKNQEKEAKKWFSSVTSSIDRLLYLNTLASGIDLPQLSSNLKQLEALKPEAFELNGKKYTADDMRLLLLLTKCKYAKSLSDDSLLLNSARQVDDLLSSSKCSKDFTALLRTDCLTVLFDYNYLLGDFQQAKSQIEKLLSSKGFDPVSRAQYLMRHGMCCMALGENQNAAKSLKEAGGILREGKYKDLAIICYRNLACAEYRAGNYSDALNAMRNCAAVNSITDHKEDTSVTEAILIVELAALYHNTEFGRKGKEEEFKRLRLRAERLTQPGNIADFALAEATFRRDIVRRPKMEEQIQALERYFNYTRSTTPESLLRSPLFLPMRESEAQKMLLKALKKTGDVGKLDFWNKKFEQGRVRSLAVSADSAHAGVKAEEFADMNMLEIIAQCSDAKAIVETEKRKPQDQRDEKLIQAATSTLRRLENLFEVKKMRLAKDKAAKFNALMADNFVIHPDSMNQLASVLPAETACLQFIPVDDEIIVYIISRNAPPIMHQIDLKKHQKNAKSFFNQVRKLRMLLQRAGSNERVQRDLNAVYKIVFADLEAPLAKMQTKKLLVNSSGILRYIPFAALYDGQNFLVEKYQVTNATGLDLVRLSRSAAKRQYEKTNIAVFADPDGSLPSGRKEGAAVAEFFPVKQVFSGKEASLAKLESLTGSVNFIHLATHGVIDSTTPRNSYIMMANGRNWRYCDMMGFNVENVDSIVLSACNSAMSENCAGGEIEGMAYQLLKKSPSGSVVASFWKVDDKATSKLMTAYYAHIAKSLKTSQTLDRGGALRAAQLELLKSPETRNPYFWAAFTLFGDCR